MKTTKPVANNAIASQIPGTNDAAHHPSPQGWRLPAHLLPVLALGLLVGSPVSAVERDLVGEERAQMRPRCNEVIVNGILADSFLSLENLKLSADKQEVLGRYPLRCSRRFCRGMADVRDTRAWVENWTQNYIYVTVPLLFEDGRHTVYLWVDKSSASCPK